MKLIKQTINFSKNYNKFSFYCSLYLNNVKFYCTAAPTAKTEQKSKYDLNLVINNVDLTKYVQSLEKEFKESDTSSKSSRQIELLPIIKILEERRQIVENLTNIDELSSENDEDLKKLALEEKEQFLNNLKAIDDRLLTALFPHDRDDNCNSMVLEVNAGVGGQEAMLFAKEIFDMYCGFCEYKGYELEIAEYAETDLGGIRRATALISGPDVFRYFKHEGGVHRVQRTPATEKAGRIHTSTASVVILPQPTEIEVNINPKDLKIETKRSSGAGGQHVNTTDSCVRITHLPTNITVECQVDRSQIKNRKMAMTRLKALLYQRESESQQALTEATRKSQVRSNYRNEKIRTYNFNQDRITDHRIQASVHNLKVFMEGGAPLEELIEKLDYQYRLDSLLEIVNSYCN